MKLCMRLHSGNSLYSGTEKITTARVYSIINSSIGCIFGWLVYVAAFLPHTHTHTKEILTN